MSIRSLWTEVKLTEILCNVKDESKAKRTECTTLGKNIARLEADFSRSRLQTNGLKMAKANNLKAKVGSNLEIIKNFNNFHSGLLLFTSSRCGHCYRIADKAKFL